MKPFLLSLLAAACVSSASAASLFRNPQPIPIAADSVSDLMTADFNGDGHQDALLIDPSGSLVVMIANGTGPFAAPAVTPMTSTGTEPPAIGDVNQDGKLDVVVTDWQTRNVTVMNGNGDGTFTAGSSFHASFVGPLALGDFNGDQLLDLAMGSFDDPNDDYTVAVYAGNGAGGFSNSAATTLVTWELVYLQAADFNNDGRTDLLAGSWNSNQILLGNGDGTFIGKGSMIDGGFGLADFNHDGKLDLATASGDTHEWYVAVSLGNGDGTLTTPVRYGCGYDADDIAATDLDGDGNTDLLIASTASSTVAVLRGNADGTFRGPEFYVSGNNTWKLVVSDFDRDGFQDFLTVDYNSELWAMSFVRGTASGGFATYRAFQTSTAIPVPWPGLEATGGKAADVDGDGDPDVVLTQERSGQHSYDLAVLLNDGTGALGLPMLTSLTLDHWPDVPVIDIGDINHDGKLDVVASTPYRSPGGSVLLGNGDGTFAAAMTLTLATAGRPTLAHLNGDAHLDLFVPAANYQVNAYPGNGDGTFGAAIQSPTDGFNVAVGDLNGDGKADYVSSLSWTRSCLNNGSGAFACTTVTSEDNGVVALADFDADGKLDLLIRHSPGTQIRFGNGDGTFGSPVNFDIEPVPQSDYDGPVLTKDFDGDGKLDVSIGTSIYLGNGDGTFHSRERFRANGDTAVDAADMDGNGSLDLVVTKRSADSVHVLLTRTLSETPDPVTLTLSADVDDPSYAQSVTFTATVAGGAIPRSGVVLFAIDGTPRALIAVNREGIASLSLGFDLGPHEVTASYSGDEYYGTASDSHAFAVRKQTTSISAYGFPNPSPARRILRVVPALSGSHGHYGFQPPTGTITIREGDTVLGTVPIGTWFQISTLSVGNHSITAHYPGDAHYESSSVTYEQVITKPVPTVVITTTPNTDPIFAGQAVTIRGTFPGSSGITGTVSLFVDNIFVATAPVAQGAAEFQTSFTWGSHQIRLTYSGNDEWAQASNSTNRLIYVGPWGTPLEIRASGTGDGGLRMSWSLVQGAVSYTVWKKISVGSAWEVFKTYSSVVLGTSTSMPANTTWLMGVTATDEYGNVTQMSVPDLVTSIGYSDDIFGSTRIKAQQFVEVRAAINSVRLFGGLPPFAYSRAIVPGQIARTSDVTEMRTALTEGRSASGVHVLTFTDPELTPGVTPIRAVHMLELRAGAN